MAVPRGRARWLLAAGVVLVAVAAAGWVTVRQLLGGGSLRAAAETRLSAMLGQPVTMGSLNVDLFPHASIAATAITVGRRTASSAPAIDIERIVIVPRLRSLFSGPVGIDDVRLEGLVVSVLRDRAGAWHVPNAVPAPSAGSDAGVAIDRVGVTRGRVIVFEELAAGGAREVSSIDDIEADAVVENGGLRLRPVTARIGGAAITGEARTDAKAAHLEFGATAIDDEDLPALLGLLGVARPSFLRLHAPGSATVALRIDRVTSRLSGKGTLRAPESGVEPLRLQQFEAPFTLEDDRLVFEPTVFTVHKGTHRGGVAFGLAGTATGWSIDSRVTGLDLGSFLDALSGADARIDGAAAVTAALRGRLDAALAESIAGRLQISVEHGVIRQFPLLAAINSTVRLTEGDTRDTRFERLTATLQLANGRAVTDNLVMQAGQVRVDAAGTIGFNRSLAMRGKAVLSAERSAAAIRSVHELAGLRNRSGQIEIPLTIEGTIDDPSFALDVRAAIGKGLQDELMRRLRRIIKF